MASNTILYQVRRTNLAGAIRFAAARENSATAGNTNNMFTRAIVRNNSGADITDNIVLTIQAVGAGTVTDTAGATFPRYMEIRDIGESSDYPGAIQI